MCISFLMYACHSYIHIYMLIFNNTVILQGGGIYIKFCCSTEHSKINLRCSSFLILRQTVQILSLCSVIKKKKNFCMLKECTDVINIFENSVNFISLKINIEGKFKSLIAILLKLLNI